MKILTLSSRTFKEVLRDPLTLAFGLGFPVIILLTLTIIQSNIPVSLFELENLTPAILIFGMSFITLFSATLIAKDRESSLLLRLYSTPLKATDFIISYTLPFIPMALIQGVITYIVAIILGLKISVSIIYSLLLIIPISLLFIGLGLLLGSILNVKQVGGICGAFLTNLTAFLSGIWFDLNLIGEFLKTLATLFPFYHAVELQRGVFTGNFSSVGLNALTVLGYVVVITALSVLVFLKQMKNK